MGSLSEQVARENLQLFYDYYEFSIDDIKGDSRKAVDNSETRLIRAIQKGRLKISEDEAGLKITQLLKNPTGDVKEIGYSEISGQSKLAMKGKGEDDNHGRMYALLGSLSGLGEMAFAKLKGVDLSIAECLGLYFLLI